ncbi:hypothetical protein JQ633_23345 [Bradyrhizobium tropiciagri]|nr:hypothetical protein [Bradyrhizobium tropiciagri]
MNTLVQAQRAGSAEAPRTDPIALIPVLAAVAHPFLLMLFHGFVGPPGTEPSTLACLGASLTLLLCVALPFLGIAIACRPDLPASLRRLAYTTVIAPTLFVFVGVVQGMFRSPVPDAWLWCLLWLVVAAVAVLFARNPDDHIASAGTARWRVAHGVSAAVICLFILFHIGNHLAGLLGPQTHAAVMNIGRSVYRMKVVEPLLAALFLFQVASGLRLAWRWSATPQGFFRTFQVASGIYLAVFCVGHMNSVFINARTILLIPTDWTFAVGGPTGLIHDPWNIRLAPHYALGVFFVLSHLLSGLRVVLLAHGGEQRSLNRIWLVGVLASAAIAVAIIAGMGGVRL